MKALKKVLVIFMTVTMMFFGISLDGFAALSFAAEEQDVTAAQEQTEAEGDAEQAESSTKAEADSVTDQDLTKKTLKSGSVRLEGMMPEDAKLAATDASGQKAVKKLEKETGNALAAYDITIKADGDEYQPDAEHPIRVRITDKDIKKDSNLTLWHIHDDGSSEQIEDFTISKGKITFEATGFSVYVIVEGPEPFVPTNPEIVNNMSELPSVVSTAQNEVALFLSVTRTVNGGPEKDYFTNTVKSNGAIQYTTVITEAEEWFFEAVTGQANQYYLYTYVAGAKKYLAQDGTGNNVKLVDAQGSASAFEASSPGNGLFIFKLVGSSTNRWLQYSGGGTGFRLYDGNSNAENIRITITKAASVPFDTDIYQMDGLTYGLMYRTSSTAGNGLLTTAGSTGRLKSLSMLVRNDPMDQSRILYVAKGSSIPMWTFHWIAKDQYYLSTEESGVTKYLRIGTDGLTCVDSLDNYCTLKLVPGTGDKEGRIRLIGVETQKAIDYNGTYRVMTSNASSQTQWLNLADYSVYTDDDFVSYSAAKTSVVDVQNGDQIIIYTRVWNEAESKYEFYAIDHNGDMLPCYESGDAIVWIGTYNNTAVWNFTVNYQPGTTTPNNYYELQNDYTGKYIMPVIADPGGEGQIFSTDPGRGVNLNGRRDKDYSSTILAWDDAHYDYAGLKVVDGKLVSCPMAESAEFFFAVMNKPLQEVATVDHSTKGVTMKMVKFDDSDIVDAPTSSQSPTTRQQLNVMGTQDYSVANAQPNLLTKELADSGTYQGYPTATLTARSLGELFAGGTEVNHLFIDSIYQSSGYFQYDSTQTFASLRDLDTGTLGSEFTVYQQLGRVAGTQTTRKHGQFMPYNRLNTNSILGKNETDIYGKTLSDNDPRKGEILYGFKEAESHYFGMEIEGGFMQTPSGKDEWGHDIIFEFVGDDDFWLYVDGELVIDLGGIHQALGGSVNYSTGKVVVNGTQTTLYAIFESNYRAKQGYPERDQATAAQNTEVDNYLDEIFQTKTVNGASCKLFKDYSSHKVRIFYMERGAGASNLRMRFNMATITPGQVQLTKEVTGSDKENYASAKIPFQLWYDDNSGAGYRQLGLAQDPTTHEYNVVYAGTSNPVDYAPEVYYEGTDVRYESVFFLRPGETAAINFLDDSMKYKIVECYVDPNTYDSVQANGDAVTGTAVSGSSQNREDYESTGAAVKQRTRITFSNHVNPTQLQNLIIKKRLFDENDHELTKAQDPTGFTMRVYLGRSTDNPLPYYSLGEYYVKDDSAAGNYCYWDSSQQTFVSTGITTYSGLMDAVRAGTYSIGQVAFQTSLSGAISQIPAGYSIEIRDLLPGTKFKVVEEDYDIPIGYGKRKWTEGGTTYTCYKRADGTNPFQIDEENAGEIEDEDPVIEVHNQKGYGIRAYKEWSDGAIMRSHDKVLFAVFVGNSDTPLTGSVHEVDAYAYTTWFFSSLESGANFSDYHVFEVIEHVDGQGNKTYTKVRGNQHIILDGVAADGSPVTGLEYIATYKEDTDPRARIDTVTNTRIGGLEVDLKDWSGDPLSGGKFELVNYLGEPAGTFSATDGLVSMMYFADGTYTLTEAKTPAGYQAPATVFTIEVSNGGTTFNVTSTGTEGWNYDSTNKILTINNRPFTLTVNKKDSGTTLLSGAHFAMYKQIRDGSGARKDYYPFPNYEDLVSDSNGVLTNSDPAYRLDNSLTPGTYYLTETEPPSGYELLNKDVLFTVSADGFVSIDHGSQYTGELTETQNTNSVDYVITIRNTSGDLPAPTSFTSIMGPFIWMLIIGLALTTLLTFMRRRRLAADDIAVDTDFASEYSESAAPKESAETAPAEYEAFDWTRITFK